MLGLAGCTWTPHQVKLTAEPSYTLGQQIGEGIRLNVVVIDDRDQRVVGQRDVGAIGSDITSPQLMNFLQRQVTKGFQRHGFVLVSDNELAHAKVTVFLRSFKWDTEMGFWMDGENVFVSLRVDAQNATTKDNLVKTFQYHHEERILFIAFGPEITNRMNAGLTNVLAQLFSNDELMRFLRAARTNN